MPYIISDWELSVLTPGSKDRGKENRPSGKTGPFADTKETTDNYLTEVFIMTTATLDPRAGIDRPAMFIQRIKDDPGYQAFLLLRVAFTVAPIVFGLDKFANVLVDWEVYLAPWINDIVPGSASTAMYVIGVVEIAAGLTVLLKPRYGAYIVAAWLGGIIINLLTYSGYYDVALRDFGLMLGALTLGRLAGKYDPPGLTVKL